MFSIDLYLYVEGFVVGSWSVQQVDVVDVLFCCDVYVCENVNSVLGCIVITGNNVIIDNIGIISVISIIIRVTTIIIATRSAMINITTMASGLKAAATREAQGAQECSKPCFHLGITDGTKLC